MQDGVYIEYLMEQRIMRRTNIMDELHKIYAGKYERWIRQYLISKQILEAPLFIFVTLCISSQTHLEFAIIVFYWRLSTV